MADSYSPPEGVRAEARRALKWIEEGHAGGGFTDTGRKRASDLARGAAVSLKTIKRMNSFLARHEVDKQGKGFSQGSDGYPSAGRVSWAAWGGDAGKSWAAKILASVEKSVDAIASDPMQMDLDLASGWAEGEIAWDELPQNVKDAIDEVMAEDFSEEVEESVGVVVKADEQTELLHKADSEHRFTLGPWYIPNRYDAHGEWTDADELQKALWEYVRSGDRDIRLQHNRDIVAGEWLEAMSFPVPVSIGMQKSGESKQVTYPSGTVFLGVQWKPWAWEMVKEGKIRGFSIGGAAARIEMEMPADAIAKASFGGDRSAAGRYAAEQRWKGSASSGQKAYGVLDEVATRVMGRVAQARARKAAQVADRGEQSLFGRIKYVFSREYTNPEPLARKWVKEAVRQSRMRDTGDKQFESVVDLPKGRQAILSQGRLLTVGKTVDRDAIRASVRSVVKQQPTSSQVHVDTVMGSKKKKKKRPSRDEVLKRGGLGEWFEEKWVDLSRPKEGGGFEECGRPDATEGKYPKCVPASKAGQMSASEIKSAVRRKRKAESEKKREGKKPINVPTLKKSRNVPTDMKLYSRVKSEARKKFDVYPSAYANAWLVREYKKRGGRYRIEKAVSFGGDRSAAGRYAANQRWQGSGHVSADFVRAWHKEFGRGPIRYPTTKEGLALARIMPSLNTHCDLDALAADYRATGTNTDSVDSPNMIYKHLSEERRAVWDGILRKGDEGVPKGTNPEGSRVFVKAGGGGAGKSTTPQIEGVSLPTTGEKGSARSAVMSNADDIKEQLPEYQQAALSKTNTMMKTPKGKELPTGPLMDRRASMNHEESAQLAAYQVTVAIKGGKDVVVDGTMDNGVEKALGKLASYREGGAKEVHMVVYSCDTTEAEERAYRRSKETGRSVPSESLRKAHIKVSTNFPTYLEKGKLDSVVVMDTNLNDDGSKRDATKIFEYKPSGGIKILNNTLYERFLSKRNDSTKSGINPVQIDKLIQEEIVRSEG
jgi:hypothetical protein